MIKRNILSSHKLLELGLGYNTLDFLIRFVAYDHYLAVYLFVFIDFFDPKRREILKM